MHTHKVIDLIGDYRSFFQDIVLRLTNLSIDVQGLPISHIAYRVETLDEYRRIQDGLIYCSKSWVETQFNGRAISIFELDEPIDLAPGYTCSVIELPAPRAAHTYPDGLEHAAFYMETGFDAFTQQHANLITGYKDRRPYCEPAFIQFDNGTVARFYNMTLRDLVEKQGWVLK